MERLFTPRIQCPPTFEQPAWWFAFVGQRLLVHTNPPTSIPQVRQLSDLDPEVKLLPLRVQGLGDLDGMFCYAAELPADAVIPAGMQLIKLRDLYSELPDDLFALAGRAVQIVDWDRTHQYCGFCATPTTQLPDERAKRCPNCGLVNYPRLSPAAIVLISRGAEILLARAPRFPAGMYSILAGFVEPGESLEETVVREVREEVGLEIGNIRYFGSQPWPYPNSLMVGFTATYVSGEIVLDPTELVEAGWFHKQNLPQIPPKLSIARKLIDWFVAQPD
ncbi:MAG: NAD(+) diphosphatase [Elainella sp.]